MIIVIDESGSFSIKNDFNEKFKIQLFSAVFLNNKAEKKWIKKYSKIKKGFKHNENEASQIIKDLVLWKAKALSVGTNLSLINRTTCVDFKKDFSESIISSIEKYPEHSKTAILEYVKKFEQLSLEESVKILLLLQLLENAFREYFGSLDKLKSVDSRKLKIVIDSQSKPLLPFIHHFIHFYMFSKAIKKPIYSSSTKLIKSNHKLKDQDCLNLNEYTKKLKINSDDLRPVLKCADCIANFTRRTLIGNLQFKGYEFLPELYRNKYVPGLDLVHFNPNIDGDVFNKVPNELIEACKYLGVM